MSETQPGLPGLPGPVIENNYLKPDGKRKPRHRVLPAGEEKDNSVTKKLEKSVTSSAILKSDPNWDGYWWKK